MMETCYVAYGLQLTSEFELPGMRIATLANDRLPAITLGLRTRGDLRAQWSGAPGPPEWSGRLGDGLALVIERGTAGDVLFSYGDRAQFRLSPDMTQLDCAPREEGLDWQRVLIGKVLSTISLMHGYEALHAAVIDSPEGVVAIMAPSGSGKSTLAVELLGRGWPLFSDDILVLQDTGGAVLAHAGTPHMNLAVSQPNSIDPQTIGDTIAILTGERWLVAHSTRMEPRPVRMLCVLTRAEGLRVGAHRLSSSPLPLAPYMLGLATDMERQRSCFELVRELDANNPTRAPKRRPPGSTRSARRSGRRRTCWTQRIEFRRGRMTAHPPQVTEPASTTRSEAGYEPPSERKQAIEAAPLRLSAVSKRWRKDLPLSTRRTRPHP